MVDAYVAALLRERAGYVSSPRLAHKVIPVDQELGRLGFGVDSDGALVKLDEVKPAAKRVGRPAKERAVSPAPERAVDDD